MDVTCQNCGTEYDFDETLVSERGTTVKCTHLFKVYRPGGGDARPWIVRYGDGREQTVSTLRELQKSIVAGELTENDDIARQGEAYKPLGSIAELSSFFAQARASQPAPLPGPASIPVPAQAPRRAKGTLMGYSPSADSIAPPQMGSAAPPANMMPLASPSAPPPRQPVQPAAQAPQPAAPQPVAPRSEPPRPRAPSSTPPEPARPNPAAAAAAKAAQRTIAKTRASDLLEPEPPETPYVAPANTGPLRYVDDDDDEEVTVKGLSSPKWGRWFFLLLLLALAGVGYWQRDAIMERVQAFQGPPPDPAAPFLAEAETLMRGDDVDGYSRAIHELIRATAVAEHDPRVLTALAQGYGLKAQLHEFDAQDLVADAGDDSARLAEAAGLRHVARDAAQEARHKAEDAVRAAPESVEARIALADALRLSGDVRGARQHYDRATELASVASAEQLRVGALLAAAEAEDFAEAVDLAQRAVGADAGLIRARIVLARALLASGNGEAARAHVAHVLSTHPSHPGALAVQRRLDGDAPQPSQADEPELTSPTPAPATGDAPIEGEGGVDNAAPREGSSGRGAGGSGARDDRAYDEMVGQGGGSEGAAAGGDDEVEMDDGRPPAGRDYSWYIQHGDTALRGGNLSRAESFYIAALEVRPGSSEAMSGVGNVLLRRGRASDAVDRFRSASRQGYGPAFIGLGRANEALGRRGEAIQAYEDYLQRSPSGSLANTARTRISALRPSAPAPDPGSTPAPTPAPTPTPGSTPAPTPTPGSTTAPAPTPSPAPTAPTPAPAPTPAAPAPTTPAPAGGAATNG